MHARRIHGIHIPNELLKLCMLRNTEYAERQRATPNFVMRKFPAGSGGAVYRGNTRINCGNYKVSSL